jgi:hypothetical protein
MIFLKKKLVGYRMKYSSLNCEGEKRICTFPTTPLNTSLIEVKGNFVIYCAYLPNINAKVRIYEIEKKKDTVITIGNTSVNFLLAHPDIEFGIDFIFFFFLEMG